MAGVAVWNPGIFLAMFPEFTAAYNLNPARFQGVFTYRAPRFLSNDPTSPVQDVQNRLGLLNMLVAHILYLDGVLSADGQARPVGRVSDASEGSVSASFDYGEASQNNGQWFNQSQYGAEFWQATSSLRGFRYSARPTFVNRTLRRFGVYLILFSVAVISRAQQVPTPTFTPPAGNYTAPQAVSISSSTTATTIVSMTEGSNGNASNGDAPSRNAYTNCATGWNGSQLTPVGQPVGQAYCTSTIRTNAMNAGGPNLPAVSSTLSGVGIHSLDNGNGAGGVDSLLSITAVYGQANQNGCPVGTNISTSIPGLTLPGNVSAANTTYGATTGPTHFNSSSLEPTKWVVSNGASGRYWVRETCQKINTNSVGGAHLEYDANLNTANGVYVGEGWDYDVPNQKFRAGPQNSPWKNLKLKRIPDGAVLTTINAYPNDHWVYTQIWMHNSASCLTATPSTASSCKYYWDRLCYKDFTVGGSLTCYDLIDAATGVTPFGSGLDKSTWTRNEFALQHQWDVNGANANLINTVDFDNMVVFSVSPTAYYTTDGTNPTTSSAAYYLPVPVAAPLTLKAFATAPGSSDSNIGTAAYTFNSVQTCGDPSPLSPNLPNTYSVPPNTLPITVGFSSPTAGCVMHYTSDGSTPTCSSASYPGGGFTINALGTYTYKVIACQNTFVTSNPITGVWRMVSGSGGTLPRVVIFGAAVS